MSRAAADQGTRARHYVDPALRRRRELQADLTMLVLCATVIVLSMVLAPSDSQLTLFGWELPPMCLWKGLTGRDCLGCGLTRSFTYMGHGMLRDAWHMHKVGPVLWAACLLQVPWRLRMIVKNLRPAEPLS
ncbi:MAG: DUF2752 domain-containing protein [Alphaproteobacteria bacterium]|nr:DUF2752 domain-containing protein [Alphaproteobacteria bacterium]